MDFNVDIDELQNKIKEACIETLEDTATIAVAETQLITPVKNGNLRRSITHGDVDEKNLTIDIGSSLGYAKWVEEGYNQKAGQYVPVLGKKLTGKHINGRWMIRDGITLAEAQMDNILKQKLEERFKK